MYLLSRHLLVQEIVLFVVSFVSSAPYANRLTYRARYIESVSSKAERIMAELNESSSELVAFVECA